MSLPSRLIYGAAGIGHSFLSRIQRASYEEQIKAVVCSTPIFLLGFWRSGTTFLHELFCCDRRFGFPSTYACLHASHFMLTESWNQKLGSHQAVGRPMDAMMYSWDSPQEDEFALLALGARSPYEGLIFPSLLRDSHSLLNFCASSLEEQDHWAETFQYFLRLLTIQQQHKRLVLKSPPHGFRLAKLIRLFPQARYVIIERNPYEVFASNLKLWRTLLDRYGLEPLSSSEIESFVLSAYTLHEEAIENGTRNGQGALIAHVRYEDLVAAPISQMERLYEELKLGDFEKARPSWTQHVQSVASHKRNQFQLSLAQKNRIESQWGELIRKKGYCLPESYISVQ